jgi:long-chain acyl-CoA synthetase
VLSAGARLPFDTVRAFHEATGRKIKSLYGTSETGGICFDGSEVLDARVPVGRPMGATLVTLVDDPEAPPGTGRIQVRGPSVIDRYAAPAVEHDDDRRDVAALGGTFLTSDYARVDDNGVYVLAGRAATFVNVAGRKVQPQEVEAAIRALPGVRDVIALGVADQVRGQALGVCIASTRGWNARTIREALSSTLAPYKLPRIVAVVDALPLTDRGKVDRVAVARLLGQA